METESATTVAPPVTRAKPRAFQWPWIHLFQPTHFVVRELTLPIADLSPAADGMRIIGLSDMHLKPVWFDSYDLVVDAVRAASADLVLLNGDIVDDRRTHLPSMAIVRRFLPALKSRLGTFTILGNHDSVALGKDLEELGIQVLNGRRVVVETGASPVELIGAPGPMLRDLPDDFAGRFGPPAPGIARIVMAHFPACFPRLQSLRPDIYLCGHTHGGQVCLPGGILLVRHDPSPRRLCRGYHRIGTTHYIVNHGLGYSGLPVRAFCPPEILLLILRRAGKSP